MHKPEDIPEDIWAIAGVELAGPIPASGTKIADTVAGWAREIASRAILAERERCARIADAVANDDGELMARGYRTSEERASRAAGRSIAKAIRSQP